MSNELAHELRIVQKMLGTLMRHEGLLQWVDQIAFGQNEGGMYCSLFNSKANYRVSTVYSEQFFKLPDYVQAIIPDDAGDISTEKARVEKMGLLKTVPGFMISRYKLNHDDEKDKWRFGDVLYTSAVAASAPEPAPEPEPEPAPEPERPPASVAEPPAFASMNEAVRWAVECGVFTSYAAAKDAYVSVKKQKMPGSQSEMFTAWTTTVQDLALWKTT